MNVSIPCNPVVSSVTREALVRRFEKSAALRLAFKVPASAQPGDADWQRGLEKFLKVRMR